MKHITCTPDENRRFQHLYEFTLALCDLEPEDHPVSNRPLKKWSDLANIWYLYPDRIGCENIFHTVLHHIHWGLYPDGTHSDKLLELLQLVEREVLDSGCANRSWLKRTDFKKALNYFRGLPRCDVQNGPRYHFYSTIHYLSHRTMNLVRYKFHNFSDRSFTGKTEDKKHYLDVRKHYYVYEQAVRLLVPEAANWDHSQWADDRKIEAAISSLYGVVFSKRSEYDTFISLFERACVNGEVVAMADYVKIKFLPPELIRLAWPTYTDRLIIDEFLAAYNHAKKEEKKYSSYSEKEPPIVVLEQSWLFKETSRVVDEYNDHAIKKVLFEVSVLR